MSQLFVISFGTASVFAFALIRHASGSFEVSSSGAFTGLLDVRRMLGGLIVVDRGVRSLALLGVCLSIICRCLQSFYSVLFSSFSESASQSICRCARHHLTELTYCRSLSPLVDSCPGALAAASLLNW